ncbi:hypothetical protein UFOVP815_49 [uncultured Caudovirales phage]|jgi:hypothetical protein|uniref:Uncharacterized protein n=1 Tax=uncultured Caudovirales phage TaxID=2100421 RepID=A0A6J5P0I8_9CAUD|nr:hypothetical protein UFOVP815_49 [uncultured Caudovirales phage]
MSDALIKIATLAALLRGAEANVADLTADLQEAKEEVRRLQEDDLPELMRELGLSEIKLEDGAKVTVVNEVDCNISEERRSRAHAWLADNGFGGIIKSAITVEFGRDEHAEALEAAEKIHDVTGRDALLKEGVHPQTLKAFVKEQMAAGVTVPQELFGIRPYSKAKLTKAKSK